jgi:hypothetical protein
VLRTLGYLEDSEVIRSTAKYIQKLYLLKEELEKVER